MTFKNLFRKHRHLWSFERQLSHEEINETEGRRFEYICRECGAKTWFFFPVSCAGCKHCYTDEGSVHCDRTSWQENTCLKSLRLLFEANTEEKSNGTDR